MKKKKKPTYNLHLNMPTDMASKLKKIATDSGLPMASFIKVMIADKIFAHEVASRR